MISALSSQFLCQWVRYYKDSWKHCSGPAFLYGFPWQGCKEGTVLHNLCLIRNRIHSLGYDFHFLLEL